MDNSVYTVGHSNYAVEKFIDLLIGHNVAVVCDVRSKPYSRVNPQFNRETLKHALRDAGIKYVFLGKELGARSDDMNCYRNGQVQYDLLAQTALFKTGIARVREGARNYRLALMCAEKEPVECHRTILVSRALNETNIPVRHILSDGRVESHEQTIRRLVSMLRIREEDMFRSSEEVVEEAYARQAQQIAYREQSYETGQSKVSI